VQVHALALQVSLGTTQQPLAISFAEILPIQPEAWVLLSVDVHQVTPGAASNVWVLSLTVVANQILLEQAIHRLLVTAIQAITGIAWTKAAGSYAPVRPIQTASITMVQAASAIMASTGTPPLLAVSSTALPLEEPSTIQMLIPATVSLATTGITQSVWGTALWLGTPMAQARLIQRAATVKMVMLRQERAVSWLAQVCLIRLARKNQTASASVTVDTIGTKIFLCVLLRTAATRELVLEWV
jgi:hypothetical protein